MNNLILQWTLFPISVRRRRLTGETLLSRATGGGGGGGTHYIAAAREEKERGKQHCKEERESRSRA